MFQQPVIQLESYLRLVKSLACVERVSYAVNYAHATVELLTVENELLITTFVDIAKSVIAGTPFSPTPVYDN